MKTSKDYVVDANSVVQRMSAEDAVKHHGDGSTLFWMSETVVKLRNQAQSKALCALTVASLNLRLTKKTHTLKKNSKKQDVFVCYAQQAVELLSQAKLCRKWAIQTCLTLVALNNGKLQEAMCNSAHTSDRP